MTEEEDYRTLVTHKIWKGTHRKLRMLYAITGKPMVHIMDRLVSKELDSQEEDGDPDERDVDDTEHTDNETQEEGQ